MENLYLICLFISKVCDIETSNQMDHNDAFDPIESKLNSSEIKLNFLTLLFICLDNLNNEPPGFGSSGEKESKNDCI